MLVGTAAAIDPTGLLGVPPFFSPDQLLNLVGGLLHGLGDRFAQAFSDVTEYYVLWTGNFNSHTGPAGPCLHAFDSGRLDPPGCRFTDNAVLRGVYGLTSAMAMSAMVAILTYAFARSMFEHSFHARFTLKVLLPKLLVVIVMVSFGLAFMQQAVDLNNAAVDAIWGYHSPLAGSDSNLWRLASGGPPGDLVLGLLFFLVAVLLVVLLVSSVARNLLLVILVAAAPLAFMCSLLPELDSYADSWRRLFVTAVFTQVCQVLVLRLALLLMFDDHGVLAAIHGLVALYLTLRVPGALHASSHLESKVLLSAKHAAHHGIKALQPPAHHARAHSSAA